MVKKIGLFLAATFFSVSSVSLQASDTCFFVKEGDRVLCEEGDTKKRYSPGCSMNLVIGSIAFQKGVLQDEKKPVLPYKEAYQSSLEKWRASHNPTEWMNHSCPWFSAEVVKMIGEVEYKDWIKKLGVGNGDVSGDRGKENAFATAHMSSSYENSPQEYMIFLQKFLANELPGISVEAHTKTKNILPVEDLPEGWKYYGKGGTTSLLNHDRTQRLDTMQGWYVGWIEKESRKIAFIYHITDDQPQEPKPSIRAKEEAKKRLVQMIQEKKL